MAHHETRLFLIPDDGRIRAVARDRYAAWLRGEAALPDWARGRVRVADWYVETAGSQPIRLVNETYAVLIAGEAGGRLRQPGDAAEPAWAPSRSERDAMLAFIFGPAHAARSL